MAKVALAEGGKRADSGGAASEGLRRHESTLVTTVSDEHGDETAPASGVRAETQTSHPLVQEDVLRQLRVGDVIDGKYRVDAVLGRGAMGLVVSATHVHLRERVALKFLYVPSSAASQDFRGRFRREAQVSAKLRNEHIARVLDVGVWRQEVPFMVMDLIVGVDLRELVPSGQRLPLPTALDYVLQVCEGLAEAHANGIVHRDLKPSNLFLTKRPDGSELIKILDFGISKWSSNEADTDEELTAVGAVLGTPKYMAPEQLFGAETVDARADLWSIGAILYRLLAGRAPYDQPTVARMCQDLALDSPPPSLCALNPEVTPELEAVIMRCFQRDRQHRAASLAELAGSLLDAIGAPFAATVRARIQAVLDAGASRGERSERTDRFEASASGPTASLTGSYASAIAHGRTGSWSTNRSREGSREESREGSREEVAPALEASTPQVAPSPPRRGFIVFAMIFALTLVAALVWVVLPKSTRESPAPSSSPLETPTSPATTAEPARATTTTATTITPTTTGTVASNPSGTNAASSSMATSPKLVHPGFPAPKHTTTSTGTKPTSTAATTEPVATTTPTATATTPPPPPPTNTGKPADPLGDRQ